MTEPNKQKDKFSRKEAARYLTALGYRITPKTLQNLASKNNHGNGPPFTRCGWKAVSYERSDLDAWARARMVKVDCAPALPAQSALA